MRPGANGREENRDYGPIKSFEYFFVVKRNGVVAGERWETRRGTTFGQVMWCTFLPLERDSHLILT